jgi:hypothetical protein
MGSAGHLGGEAARRQLWVQLEPAPSPSHSLDLLRLHVDRKFLQCDPTERGRIYQRLKRQIMGRR